jgi:hypothetical protein
MNSIAIRKLALDEEHVKGERAIATHPKLRTRDPAQPAEAGEIALECYARTER